MSSVAERLAGVRGRIDAACARAGRSPDSVGLVAVSKRQPVELIREAYAAGQRHFGENYAQELRDKAQGLTDLDDIVWHFIGPLQVNKAKYVAKAADTFHALDRADLGVELSRRRAGPYPLRCLIEVNVAGEASKSGVAPAGVSALLHVTQPLANLKLVGLMTMPPLADDPEAVRPHFRALAALARSLGLAELSMGSTGDFEVAIEEGATWVRVGTAIFGERT